MRSTSLLTATICIGFLTASAVKAQELLPPEGVPVLYVQNAQTARFDGQKLILENVPFTTWFSTHPSRLAGSLSSEEYLAEWKENGAFAENPPNAALIYQTGDINETAVITLVSADLINQATYQYTIQVIEGDIPPRAENAALFVDPGGRTNPTGG